MRVRAGTAFAPCWTDGAYQLFQQLLRRLRTPVRIALVSLSFCRRAASGHGTRLFLRVWAGAEQPRPRWGDGAAFGVYAGGASRRRGRPFPAPEKKIFPFVAHFRATNRLWEREKKRVFQKGSELPSTSNGIPPCRPSSPCRISSSIAAARSTPSCSMACC